MIRTLKEGRPLTEAFDVMRASEGFGDLPPKLLSKALLARFSAGRERERREALTSYTMALVASGARIEYWDAVAHLYSGKEMEDIRRRKAEAEERKRQLDAVKDMMDMSKQRFGGVKMMEGDGK